MGTLDSILDSESIGVLCKNCGRETEKSIRWVMDNKEFICACGSVISLKSIQFKRDFSGAERSINDFEVSLKKLGR